MIRKEVKVMNETGLHARPASLLVKTASAFVSDIQLIIDEKTADAKSIINVLSLGLRKDDVLKVEASGIDEADAITHMTALFANGFGDE